MRVEQRILLVCCAAVLIPACGGGGGSGGNSSPSSAADSDVAAGGLGGSQPPRIRIVTPSGGSSCHEGATVTVQAVANDPDTTIVRVEFFDGSKLIGTRAAPPFTIALGGLSPGAHVLTAVAFDVQGLSATSDPVTIFVVARDGHDDDP